MTIALRRPEVLVWLVLVASTCVSWWLGDGHGARETAAIGVIAVAFFKVYLVGRYFMEIRGAPPVLRVAFAGWIAVVATTLVTMYLAG